MALFHYPSSFECDCGCMLHFCENTVWSMEKMSTRRGKPVLLGDGDHTIEFQDGMAVAITCPQGGRCVITGTVKLTKSYSAR